MNLKKMSKLFQCAAEMKEKNEQLQKEIDNAKSSLWKDIATLGVTATSTILGGFFGGPVGAIVGALGGSVGGTVAKKATQ